MSFLNASRRISTYAAFVWACARSDDDSTAAVTTTRLESSAVTTWFIFLTSWSGWVNRTPTAHAMAARGLASTVWRSRGGGPCSSAHAPSPRGCRAGAAPVPPDRDAETGSTNALTIASDGSKGESRCREHDTARWRSVWKRGGAASRHRDATDGHRAANLHPVPAASRIAPGPVLSAIHVRSALASGMEDRRSCVYGCRGCLTTSSTSPASATEP